MLNLTQVPKWKAFDCITSVLGLDGMMVLKYGDGI